MADNDEVQDINMDGHVDVVHRSECAIILYFNIVNNFTALDH